MNTLATIAIIAVVGFTCYSQTEGLIKKIEEAKWTKTQSLKS